MSLPVHSAITPELYPGEQVKWVGTPSLSAILLHNLTRIVFGCLFAFAPVFSGKIQSADKFGNIYKLTTTLIFFMIGSKVVFGSILEVFLASRTVYAVTDQRIIIIKELFTKKTISVEPKMINTMDYKSYKNGRGTVLFRLDEFDGLEASGIQKSGFRGVPNVLDAVEALNQLRR